MLFTRALLNNEKIGDNLAYLWREVHNQYNKQPDKSTNGGNDKDFFTFEFNGLNIWCCRNESNYKGVDGLTVMLPSDY